VPAVAAQLADAVVAELNAHAFSQSFAAVRSWAPRFDLKNLTGLHVTVAHSGVTSLRADRDTVEDEHTIEIGVQQKLASIEPAAVDPLAALLEEIKAFLDGRPRLAGFPAAAWTRSSLVATALPEHLRELRQYTGVASIHYAVQIESAA